MKKQEPRKAGEKVRELQLSKEKKKKLKRRELRKGQKGSKTRVCHRFLFKRGEAVKSENHQAHRQDLQGVDVTTAMTNNAATAVFKYGE